MKPFKLSLYTAAVAGDIHFLQDYLAAGRDPNAQSHDGTFALHLAGGAGQLAFVRALLDGGADVNAIHSNGYSAMHTFVNGPCPEALTLLLDRGADIEQMDDDLTPLMRALVNHSSFMEKVPRLEMIRILLARGAKTTTVDSTGQNVMQLAAETDFPEAASLLVAHGVDIDLANECGETALHACVLEEAPAMTRWLLNNGANTEAKVTTEEGGQTPLHYAAGFMIGDFSEYAALMLEHGANPDQRDNCGKTPNDYANEKRADQPGTASVFDAYYAKKSVQEVITRMGKSL